MDEIEVAKNKAELTTFITDKGELAQRSYISITQDSCKK